MNVSAIEKTINYLIDHHSFVLGYPNEASLIASICDYVLTSFDGNTLSIIGLIDVDMHPTKRADFSFEELDKLRLECRQFTYHAYGKKLGVNIEFWYLGEDTLPIIQETDISNMKATAYAFNASCWALDSKHSKVRTNDLNVTTWFKARSLSKMLLQHKHNNPQLALIS